MFDRKMRFLTVRFLNLSGSKRMSGMNACQRRWCELTTLSTHVARNDLHGVHRLLPNSRGCVTVVLFRSANASESISGIPAPQERFGPESALIAGRNGRLSG